jgi:hypothetical protein
MKKLINTAMFAALITGAAISANATDIQIDMYGASAQRDYWKELGYDFMTKTVGEDGMGCVSAHKSQYDGNFIVIKGETCAYAGGDDVYITYGSVASIEGVKAAKEVAPIDDKNSCAANNGNAYRQVVNTATCTWVPWDTTDNVNGVCTKSCNNIELGASDVEGVSFTQKSSGQKFGHLVHSNNTYYSENLTGESVTGLTRKTPTIVPFAFYANSDIPELTDINRTVAVNLFSGNISSLGQLAGLEAYADKGVQLCFRHAGSGTHATLDKGIMNKSGFSLVEEESVSTDVTIPNAFFYQSSDSKTKTNEAGMKQCIETNGGRGRGANFIAIGYMDADAAETSHMHRLTYNGAAATPDNINNGAYEFWAAQNVYYKSIDANMTTAQKNLVTKMMTFASSNVPAAKVDYWTAVNNLNVSKPADTSIPKFK